eukprot:7386038-Prymnesium_polylepis.1
MPRRAVGGLRRSRPAKASRRAARQQTRWCDWSWWGGEVSLAKGRQFRVLESLRRAPPWTLASRAGLLR